MRPKTTAPTHVGIVGSGPNGLAAAIAMAHEGFTTEVREAESTAGGACRSMELTLPGFVHDFGSAVYPLAAGSPFFNKLPLADHGLRWIHHSAPVAHALDNGEAVTLERNLADAVAELGPDGATWRQTQAVSPTCAAARGHRHPERRSSRRVRPEPPHCGPPLRRPRQ